MNLHGGYESMFTILLEGPPTKSILQVTTSSSLTLPAFRTSTVLAPARRTVVVKEDPLKKVHGTYADHYTNGIYLYRI